MDKRFELLLSDNRVVTWTGSDGVSASVRYVDCHRDATVVAWRDVRGPVISTLTRRAVIDGVPVL
jgi:hypothetical protein